MEKIGIESIRLTQYSHGAGCGCKISPKVLDEMLAGCIASPDNENLIVGNNTKDDAAVYDLGNGTALISTTDFFMPIVDDAVDFGKIAAANAISDVYAMGGKPVLAIAILGWPINKLPADLAGKVIEGARMICMEAGIPLAGGHSIDCPEPVFGLAVNGLIKTKEIKRNNTAKEGDLLYLTKSLGAGILSTAEKKGILQPQHEGIAAAQMMQLNKAGEALGKLDSVHAMTDVTGFGLLGHLTEMAEGSELTAVIRDISSIPLLTGDLAYYIKKNAVPGGTNRNWESYGAKIFISPGFGTEYDIVKSILADPQTSGGLLIAIDPSGKSDLESIFKEYDLLNYLQPIGHFVKQTKYTVEVLH